MDYGYNEKRGKKKDKKKRRKDFPYRKGGGARTLKKEMCDCC